MMNKEYLTVKEFAAAANISQQAVYKQLNTRLKPFVRKKGNQKLISIDALKTFYLSENSTEVEQVEQLNTAQESLDFQPDAAKVAQPDLTQNSDHLQKQKLEDQIMDLQRQIQEILKSEQEEKQFLKDQITQKDKQIESLTESLKMAQQLAAADKKKVLELEAKQQEIIEAEDKNISVTAEEKKEKLDPPPKRGFFSRLFGL